ncbi:uncharacterized protein LOC111702593 [Eurytemora carolleeae]|uniref:uncharacterized protein LOC111702593 n=1 Tax=Eurytemora carolleeae TaxID=1294199 RepID=UPI000C76E10F|nr:uncharacterized protein LOC111702593 [Eurytemora carolleeae]|eukprot:XP_023330102.1 uncharacterized protein LOC111702593 [Eurytemora affinis]
MLLVGLYSLLSLGLVHGIRDIQKNKVCVLDSDCSEGNKCFQYMCYPGKGEGKGPFRRCKQNNDCQDLQPQEGGDGLEGECFRHHDRRTVHEGICLSSRYI